MIILDDLQPSIQSRYDAQKTDLFDRAAYFAVVCMLGEENLFVSDKHIGTPVTAKPAVTPECVIFG